MSKEAVPALQKELKDKQAGEILRWALGYFKAAEIAFASSFGAEDQVITDILIKADKNASIFTLDTGHLPQETLDLIRETEKYYKINIEVIHPQQTAVEQMVKTYGTSLYYESIEKRKLCCGIRKVEPLKWKLATLKAWICGLRREQSVTRAEIHKIEWDETFGLLKINPLADWTDTQVWNYIRKNDLPFNKLHDKGYPSIGCNPCTKAIKPGEDVRAGRWWWENADQKECGLHTQKRG
ncbi:MAG: phosphoadenylyl-sulfate reductase [Endomicrobiales bacterium]|jgi:phosphoadenosine phosphosulfate reductase